MSENDESSQRTLRKRKFDAPLRSIENFSQQKRSRTSNIVEDPSFQTRLNEDQLRRLNYLIEKTEIFAHFVENDSRETFSEPTSIDETFNIRFSESPWYIQGGTMRDYQIQGLNWLISLHNNGVNGILADEMGLGKTLQAISLIGYVKYCRKENSRHLIIAPKSTLQNWINELKRWTPELKSICLIGTEDERKTIIKEKIKTTNWDVLVTSYEVSMIESATIKKIHWCYIIIDEGHRIKNDKTKLSKTVRLFKSTHRLLMTGTPLQNNLHELWALLNFLLPDIFNSADDFSSWFGDQVLLHRLHQILQPFLLRRLKRDVEKKLPDKIESKVFVQLAPFQREWYKKILMKDIDILNGRTGKLDKVRLMNMLMQLRKCTNHPYVFPSAEPGPPYTTDEHLVNSCGKMRVLDRLLIKLQEEKSRVLIFSQMTRMLDILEDYCQWRKFDYCRLDGDTSLDDRQSSMEIFNQPNSSKFLFLLSTRAGGLGINLASADVVIIYDSDFNPQVDLQAIDRAHRIGQTKTVRVFRLITENTVDERIVERAEMKLRLDHLVIQQGRFQDPSTRLTSENLLAMIQHGARKIFSTTIDEDPLNIDIDLVLAQGEQRANEIRQKYEQYNETQLRDLAVNERSIYRFEGEDYREKQVKNIDTEWIGPSKRQRTANYDVNAYYREALRIRPKAKAEVHPDFQFRSDDFPGFLQWTREDFRLFIQANVKFGRENFESIAKTIPSKTVDEVKTYADVFWKRSNEIRDIERIRKSIENGEAKLNERIRLQKILDEKIVECRVPLNQLTCLSNKQSRQDYTDEEDRFLLLMLHRLGLDHQNLYAEIHRAIHNSIEFRFDWIFKSRTQLDLKRRLTKLMKLAELQAQQSETNG